LICYQSGAVGGSIVTEVDYALAVEPLETPATPEPTRTPTPTATPPGPSQRYFLPLVLKLAR